MARQGWQDLSNLNRNQAAQWNKEHEVSGKIRFQLTDDRFEPANI
jgi:hypothetical protein